MQKGMRWGYILFLLAIVGFFAVVRPQINKVSELLLEARVRALEVSSHAQRKKDLDDIQSKGETIQSILTAQYLAMPRSSQVPEVLVMIESLASKAGVVLGSATVAAATGGEVPVTLGFTGTLGQVNSFLDAVHNNVRTAVVRNQSLSAGEGGLINLTLQIGLVYQGGS